MKPFAAAFAAVAFIALPALADEPAPPSLQASGQGIEYAVPDIAIVTLGVTSRGRTASEALTANSTDLAAAIAAITGSGVADKDIGTSGFSIYPVYAQNSDGSQTQPPKIAGYEVSNEVRVTIRDIAQSGAILDKVVTAGANQVSGIAFDISDRTTAANQAIRAAITDARAKAELMADAAGLRLVRILTLSAGENGGPRPGMAFDMAAKAAPVPVMPGQQSVSANAQVAWEVAPK